MKRLAMLLALLLAATGCAAVEAGWTWLVDTADAVVGTMGLEAVGRAYAALVELQGPPTSDREFLDMLGEAAGAVFDRREALRGMAEQALDWLLGAATMVFGQGVVSGRGRQLIGAMLGGLIHRDPRRFAGAAKSLVGGAHSGRVLDAKPVASGGKSSHGGGQPPAPAGP